MLSNKAKYALKALMYLIEHRERTQIPIGEIAEAENIPRKFLDAILLTLRKHGYLASAMGKAGGYRFARAPDSITVGEIIRVLDGPLAPIPCASRTAYRPCADCADVETCHVRLVMLDARDAIALVLDSTTLVQMHTKGGEPSKLLT
ncbi:MAG: Rrf2 family transcriptional regulator [Alphaproteobacteria bacterium]